MTRISVIIGIAVLILGILALEMAIGYAAAVLLPVTTCTYD